VLTTRRHDLREAVHRDLQALLREEDVGIEVQAVTVQELAPPQQGAVRSAFQEVQNASADKERTMHEARAYRARIMAEAEGEAEGLRSESKAERHRRITIASGEADRFLALAEQHARAPFVTEQRLYLETLEELLPKLDTYLVEPAAGGKVNLRIVK
jgi:membrane protease subunit HflK